MRQRKTVASKSKEKSLRSYPASLDGEVILAVPFAAKDFFGRAGHVDGAVFFGPMELEVAAGKMGDDASSGFTRERAGHRDGTHTGPQPAFRLSLAPKHAS